MYRRILVAVDGRGVSEGALPAVATLARRSLAEVRVVAVACGRPGPAAAASARDVAERLTAEGVMASAEVAEAGAGGARAVARAIAGAARRMRADLVALGSHGRGDLSGLVLGSVGHQVAAQLDCAVLLVRGSEHDPATRIAPRPIRRVLVAVDGSTESDGAVAEARALARELGAAALVAHAVAPGGDLVTIPQVELSRLGLPEPGRQANAIVDTAVRRLREAGGAVERRVLTGGQPVAEALAAAAEEWMADLVVLGSRRPTDLGGLLAGCVAHDLVRRTRVPVLLASRPGTRETAP